MFFLLVSFANAQSNSNVSSPPLQSPSGHEHASYNPLKNCVTPQDASSYEKRLIEYQNAISDDSKNPELYFQLGRLYARLQNWEDAQKSLFQALTYNKQNKQLASQIYHQLGNIYACQQQFDKAVPQYRKTIRNNPENEDARFNLALTQLLAQQQEKQQQEKQQNQQQQGENSQENDKKDTDPQQNESQQQSAIDEDGKTNDRKEMSHSQEQQASTQPETTEGKEDTPEEGQNAQAQTPSDKSDEEKEERSTDADQNVAPEERALDEQTTPGYLSRQQAEQLINTVPENRRKFIQRLLKRQAPPASSTGNNW